MKNLIEGGVLSKITNGVKLLGKGSDKFSALKKPITLEINDASGQAIEAVKSLTAFETTSNGASRPRILTLMSLACSLPKAASWPSSDSFSLFASTRVVPEVIGGEGEQGLRADLLLH